MSTINKNFLDFTGLQSYDNEVKKYVSKNYKQAVSSQSYIDNLLTGVNVKDYGAVGDGITDDSQAFIDACYAAYEANKDVILVPRGSYNLNHIDMTAANFNFIGEEREKCIILNSNISAPYGISCENITFDGGTARQFEESWTGMPVNLRYTEWIIFATPKQEGTNITYKNCIFKNADVASMAFWGSSGYSIGNIVIEDCLVEDMGICGLVFSTNITEAIVKNNVFKNIGNINLTNNWCMALTLGDVSNNTNNHLVKGLIDRNVFDTIITAYDMESVQHTGCCYFLCTMCDSIAITNNQFKNMIGYGLDKEGVYTKGQNIEIAYNEFYQCGSGEAYVTCKTGENYVTNNSRCPHIHHNTFMGHYGEAIRVYGGGIVHDNFININILRTAIKVFPSSQYRSSAYIHDNQIVSGIGTLTINETVVTDFNPIDAVIGTYGTPIADSTKINNNFIKITAEDGFAEKFTSAIKVQYVTADVEINNNKMYMPSNTSNAIVVAHTSNIPSTDTKVTVKIEDNYSDTIRLSAIASGMSSNNTYLFITYIIKNNVWKEITDSSAYAINLSGPTNASVLYYESEQPSNAFPKKHIYSKSNQYIYTSLASTYFSGSDYTIVPSVWSSYPALNDTTASATTTYSSQKIEQLISALRTELTS